MEGILELTPDLHITENRWRARDDTVFVEAQNSATLAGRKVVWSVEKQPQEFYEITSKERGLS